MAKLLAYRGVRGDVPLLTWLGSIRATNLHTYKRLQIALERLGQQGHLLRRPLGDYLDDGIYELRVRSGRQQLRILYFFMGRDVVVLSHGILKEGRVPKQSLRLAKEHQSLVESNRELHTIQILLQEDES
ncbi:MAG: hypothetical protein GEEBNDBF_01725 [bacterium]|nr:hypothetical protein [bacterium]